MFRLEQLRFQLSAETRSSLMTPSAHSPIPIVRPIVSCLTCRIRKVRCDRNSPCQHCRRRGEICRWPLRFNEPIEGSSNEAEKIEQICSNLTNRVAHLESVIERAGLGQALHPIITPDSSLSASTTETINDALNVHYQDDFDHQIITSKRRKLEKAFGGEQASDFRDLRIENASSSLLPHPMEGESRQSRIIKSLPEKAVCDILLSKYFDRVEWIHHILHRPSFESWYLEMWSHLFKTSYTPSLWHNLALLYSMLCLGIYFDVALSIEQHEQAAQFQELSSAALEEGKYLDHPSIAAVQTLIMQGLWLNDDGRSDRHHANLAIAIRVVHLLGISMQDKGSNEETYTISLNEELNRRIYWSLVCQDCYTASSCGFAYLIHPSLINVRKPRNLNDEDLIGRKDTEDHHQYTDMSYHIAKIPFAESARTFIDICNEAGGFRYDKVLALEDETRRLYQNLPSYLKYSDDTPANDSPLQMQWQSLFMAVTMHNRIMRLHRPFMVRGYREETYLHSTRATLDAAMELIRLIDIGYKIGFPGLQWWVVRIHIFASATACCIALYKINVDQQDILQAHSGSLSRSKLSHLAKHAIWLLSQGSNWRSTAAAHAIEVISSLHQRALDARSEHSSEKNFTASSDQPSEVTQSTLDTHIDWSGFFEAATGSHTSSNN